MDRAPLNALRGRINVWIDCYNHTYAPKRDRDQKLIQSAAEIVACFDRLTREQQRDLGLTQTVALKLSSFAIRAYETTR